MATSTIILVAGAAIALIAVVATVTHYNNGVEMFPLNIVAQMMGYTQKVWFEIPEEERQPVRFWR